CPAGPGLAIAGAMTPVLVKTALGRQSRYLVKVRSCGFSGSVTLTPKDAPASWSLAIDPAAMSFAAGASAVAQLTVSVPSDGDSGVHPISVDAAASGANTATLSADLDVAKEFAIHFAPDGTGSGEHFFLPALLTVKTGTKLRFMSDDYSSRHTIHAQAA